MTQTEQAVIRVMHAIHQAFIELDEAMLILKQQGPPIKAQPGTKTHDICTMLMRPQGATRTEVLSLTGWESVSIQQQAALCGLEEYLSSYKADNEKRYFVY